jgi:TRAP-type C4-dicarboxylate transport system substrate-binding protein
MKKSSIWKVAFATAALVLGVESASAEKVLKLGTVGFLGMPIGDAIDQALIPTIKEASGGKLTIEPHYRKSLCSEQSCGEQANQGLLSLRNVTSTVAKTMRITGLPRWQNGNELRPEA